MPGHVHQARGQQREVDLDEVAPFSRFEDHGFVAGDSIAAAWLSVSM